MWQRLSKARRLWRFEAARAFVRCVWPYVDGLGWGDSAVRTPGAVARQQRKVRWQRRQAPSDARQHEPASRRLAMRKGRCLLVSNLGADAHGGGARIEGHSRRMTFTMTSGFPQCLQTKVGARVAGSLAGTSTLACSAARACARHSLRLPLASSP